MEFLNTIPGLIVLVYLGLGCVVMMLVDRGDRKINTIAWCIGVIGWFPVTAIGFFRGLFRKR